MKVPEAQTGLRHRFALSAITAGLVGPCTYALLRGWVYLRGGGGAQVLLLRQQTIGYFQALGVSTFVAFALASAAFALFEQGPEVERLEKALAHAAIPLLLISGLLYVLLP